VGRLISLYLLTALVIPMVSLSAPPPGHVPSGTLWFPVARTGYADPLKLTGTLGAARQTLLSGGAYIGPFASVEAGPGGGRLDLGMTVGKYSSLPLWSIGSAFSMLRTWGDPLGDTESGLTCLGTNVSAGLTMLHLSGGVYRIVSGGSGKDSWLWSAGASMGI